MLGFVREGVRHGEGSLDSYGQFCKFAEQVKAQGNIVHANLIKNPPCSYNEFDKAYRKMMVRSMVIAPRFVNFMFYVAVPAQILLIIYMIVKSLDRTLPELKAWDITTSSTPTNQVDIFIRCPSIRSREAFSSCVVAAGCSESSWNREVVYPNAYMSYLDSLSNQMVGKDSINATFWRDAEGGSCAVPTFFVCAEQPDHTYSKNVNELKSRLLTQGESEKDAETCANTKKPGF